MKATKSKRGRKPLPPIVREKRKLTRYVQQVERYHADPDYRAYCKANAAKSIRKRRQDPEKRAAEYASSNARRRERNATEHAYHAKELTRKREWHQRKRTEARNVEGQTTLF